MSDKRFEDLCLLVEQSEGEGVYMMGHLTEAQRQAFKVDPSDAYKCGWNDRSAAQFESDKSLMRHAESGLSDDVRLLLAAGYAFWSDGKLSLNMNDVWAWAASWIPEVPDEQVSEVARLFRRYGNAGLLYWHSCQEKGMRSEFHDVNRAIDFVRHEEEIRKQFPSSSARAYHKTSYTLGGDGGAT